MTSHKLTKEASRRMEVMVRTNDGFEIAETDMKLRGPGEIEGTQQSGIPFDLRIADLSKDGQMIEYVRNIADEILTEDPLLKNENNTLLRYQLKKISAGKQSWRNIS
jgi:ATP-dependent DNA helicase RecG